MGRRWSQRSAWIAWILASLFGWLAIITSALLPFGDDGVSVAGKPAATEESDMRPASGPPEGKPAPNSP